MSVHPDQLIGISDEHFNDVFDNWYSKIMPVLDDKCPTDTFLDSTLFHYGTHWKSRSKSVQADVADTLNLAMNTKVTQIIIGYDSDWIRIDALERVIQRTEVDFPTHYSITSAYALTATANPDLLDYYLPRLTLLALFTTSSIKYE